MFLERQAKSLLVISTDAATPNIGGATIYNTLSMDNLVKNKKQEIVKKTIKITNNIDYQ